MRSLRTGAELKLVAVAIAMAMLCAASFGTGGGLFRRTIPAEDGSKLAGNWSGDSICLDRQSACHDEKVIYRITLYPNDATRVKVQGGKIVNGKPVTMGVSDYKWDREKNTLTHEDQFGAWQIVVTGNTMDGIMTSPAGTPFRHLSLKKDG